MEEKYLVHLFRKEVEQSEEVKLQYSIERQSALREKPPRKMTYQDLMDMCKLFLADQLKHKTEKQYDARHEPQPQANAATERVAGLAPRGPPAATDDDYGDCFYNQVGVVCFRLRI